MKNIGSDVLPEMKDITNQNDIAPNIKYSVSFP
jgi:hypothetical protein